MAAMSSPGSDAGTVGVWQIEDDVEVWQAFSAPANDVRFCQAWLALQCRQLDAISAAAVLLQSEAENTFLPVAVWPDVSRDLSFLSKVAERALGERRGVVHRPEDAASRQIHVAYPIEISGAMRGTVVLEAGARGEAEVRALLRRLHWGVGWLQDMLHRRELAVAREQSGRIGSVMEVVATALRQERLQQTLFDIVNHVAQALRCSRAAIGTVQGHAVRVAALSHSAWFEKNAAVTKAYKAVMEETVDAMAATSFRRVEAEEDETSVAQDTPQARLGRESGARCIYSLPLRQGGECLAVLIVERDSAEEFSAADVAWLDALAALLPAVIDLKRQNERGYPARLGDDAQALSRRLFGPRHLTWKLGAGLALLLIAILTWVDIDYRVTAKTVIEGETQLSAVAPFDGFVASSSVRAGDVVTKGQVLCQLDDRELKLEQRKWLSEREQYAGKLREAVANHDMTEVQVLTAQLQQAEAQYALVSDRLAQVQITAPFDGVVISGDLSQLIGSPVELGKELFQIAPLQAYRVVLQVDEGEIRHVSPGQTGKLMIAGIVGEPIPLTVSQVTPMATARDGHNFFRVEARLQQVPQQLRPGMEGVGKVNVGERGLWWVLTHSFTDWLRLTLWNWMP